jgi:hypothetical protein
MKLEISQAGLISATTGNRKAPRKGKSRFCLISSSKSCECGYLVKTDLKVQKELGKWSLSFFYFFVGSMVEH